MHDKREPLKEASQLREVEDLVRGHQPGDLPDDARNEATELRVVRREMTAEAYALWREAEALVDKEAGESLTPSERVELMARKVLQGGSGQRADEAGRASYQIALTRCRNAGRQYRSVSLAGSTSTAVLARLSCRLGLYTRARSYLAVSA